MSSSMWEITFKYACAVFPQRMCIKVGGECIRAHRLKSVFLLAHGPYDVVLIAAEPLSLGYRPFAAFQIS